MWRLRLAPVLLLLQGCALHGTAPIARDQWTDVGAVSPGTAVHVWWSEAAGGEPARKRTKGVLLKADASEIEIQGGNGSLRLARPQVTRVDVVIGGGDSLKNGALIGAAAGVAYGLFIWAYLRGEIEESAPAVVLPMATIGTAIGAGIDAIVRGDRTRTVYRATRR